MLGHMWCLMAKVHMNWPFVPIDHLKQCLILLGSVLIPMRTADSFPNTFLPWHILRTAHCCPPALSHRLAFSLLCEAASFGSERLQLGFWLLSTADVLAQHRCRRKCEREVCMCMLQGSCPSSPLLPPATTCPPPVSPSGAVGLQPPSRTDPSHLPCSSMASPSLA